jgi:hypothetical protein
MASKKKQAVNAPQNFVAKHLRQFNKAKVFIDRKKAEKRGATKHKGSPF